MNRAGAIELLMPSIQPKELWEETGRWQKFGGQLLKIRDRKDAEYCYGPTHEEVITDFARNELSSYKQLPVNFYQIQTKFRDEIRPRFGVMRAREFLMKDAYSFHVDEASLADEYRNMYDTYTRIFTRLGLKFRAVFADSGAIGGSVSHEFQVLADSGEDAIAFSDGSDYAANIELAEAMPPGRATGRGRSVAQGGDADPEDVRRRRCVDGHRARSHGEVGCGDGRRWLRAGARARRPRRQRGQAAQARGPGRLSPRDRSGNRRRTWVRNRASSVRCSRAPTSPSSPIAASRRCTISSWVPTKTATTSPA